jgi:hypothetical protein
MADPDHRFNLRKRYAFTSKDQWQFCPIHFQLILKDGLENIQEYQRQISQICLCNRRKALQDQIIWQQFTHVV